ncbi:PadR family transcriptional regulator [Weissella oryzae SG25]|uniref:PadR family transcriptional regulator n=1 Tax=Weissella oryzae (strain DSM 25784 / JCM 18191 / LMG 30913 / SG25) TaxID=1329250 RepID=A0A069CY74_WEIOS|nr:PadR family transcriptional regulator [Weissella oryzae]GAK30051.1 PadR family transcriptional regulator [Weissella oryzae SG25]
MAEISKDLIRGHTDAIILNILAQGDSYGYRIVQDIRTMSAGQYELNEATLYTVFRRLQKEALVTPYYGNETQGGRRKYYTITKLGRESLKGAQEAWRVAKPIIDQLVNGKVVEP